MFLEIICLFFIYLCYVNISDTQEEMHRLSQRVRALSDRLNFLSQRADVQQPVPEEIEPSDRWI